MDKPVGRVKNYLDQVSVAVIELYAPIKVGDTLLFKRGERSHTETVESIQIEKESLQSAKKGDVIGLLVTEPVIRDMEVFKQS